MWWRTGQQDGKGPACVRHTLGGGCSNRREKVPRTPNPRQQGTLLHCICQCQIVDPLWTNVPNGETGLPCDPAAASLGV